MFEIVENEHTGYVLFFNEKLPVFYTSKTLQHDLSESKNIGILERFCETLEVF